MKQYSLNEIAQNVGGRLIGDPDVVVSALADLKSAQAGQISFLQKSEYSQFLLETRASAVLLRESDAVGCPTNAIVVNNPYLAYAKVAQLLNNTPAPAIGVSSGAHVHATVQMGKNVSIADGAVIEANVILGDDVCIGPNTVIGRGARIGARTQLWANISIYHKVVLGEDCLVHAGTVLGADGFGYAQEAGRWVKIPQLGALTIGNRVEIGANCTIDRGAIGDTVIEDGVIIDNLVHIAHNVKLGESVAIAGCSAIAGSAVIERGVTMSGRSNVLGHITVCEGAHITACTLVTTSITKPGVYSSGTVQQENKEWRKSAVRFTQLDQMARRIKALEKDLEMLKQEKKS